MRILIDQQGGLGNQLFQYAAGLYFAKVYDASLEIVRVQEQRAVSFGHSRTFLLSNFGISAPFRKRTPWDRMMCSVAWHKRPLAEIARRLSRTQFFAQDSSTFNVFLPALPIAPSTKSLYINGNFQAYGFAQGVEQQLRTELGFCEAPSGRNLDLLNEIQASECPVSLHVRYGDYKAHSGGRSLLPMTYYQGAIKAIAERVVNPTYFVFSDDIGFARENLPKLEHVVFVDHNSEDTAHQDLRLMAACSHHIIANSTFSWWGAWLNPNPQKIVAFPSLWFNLNPTQPDLMPPTWQRIETKAPDR